MYNGTTWQADRSHMRRALTSHLMLLSTADPASSLTKPAVRGTNAWAP